MTEVVDSYKCFASNIFSALERIAYWPMGWDMQKLIRLHRKDFDGKTRVGLGVTTS